MSVTRRLAWTLVSGLLLTSLSGAYSGFVSSLLAVPKRDRPLKEPAMDFPSGPPPENAVWAQRYLPEWAVTARWQGRWGQTYFFAGRQMAVDEESAVRCAPFALVHVPDSDPALPRGNPGKVPVVILADSAVVRFPDSVDLDDPDPRLAVGCRLDGAVEVTGPDGLAIRGENFRFDREAMLVASLEPVQLAWSGHTGRADGAEVHLGESQVTKPAGLPAGPVRAVRLIRNVDLQMSLSRQVDDPDGGNQSGRWRITCEGSMVVDPVQLVATLSNSVQVRRPTGTDHWDSLACRQLTLQFRRRVGAMLESDGQGSLEFVQFQASGAPVQVGSIENDLEAQANWLGYRADAGTIELQGDVAARWERGQLSTQHVLLSRGKDGRIQRALCRGAGTMTWKQPGNPPVPVTAGWSKQMTLAPEPGTNQDLVVLEGKPVARYRTDSALTADSIRIWISRGDVPAGRGNGVGGTRVTRLIARDQVGVLTPDGYVHTALLDMAFEPISARKRAGEKSRRLNGQPTLGSGPGRVRPDEQGKRMEFWAESIRGRLGVPPAGGELALLEVVTEGRVGLSRPAQQDADPVEITGDRVRIVETDGGGHGLTIVGQPAVLRSGSHEINGPSIAVNSTSGRGSVDGSGTLSMPVDRLLSGDPAPPGTRLKVRWDEKLVLDGKEISFLGGVKSELADSRVDCDQLDVTLNRSPDLSVDTTRWHDIEFKMLRFRHSVRLTRYVFTPVGESGQQHTSKRGPRSHLAEILKARLANLQIDMVTRDSNADGPGWIQTWRRGRRRQGPLAPAALARANLPLELDAANWQYLRIDFARGSQGNIDRGFATFDDQVQVVSGQVSRPGDIVDPDRLGRDSGWMQCDSLQVTQERIASNKSESPDGRPGSASVVLPVAGATTEPASATRRSLTLQARGDATGAGRMSGQSWYGRAETISFNESSGQVVLSSLGSQKATLWRRDREDSPFSRVDAQRLVMSIRTKEVILDRAAATRLVPKRP